jgi:hypothetical protein
VAGACCARECCPIQASGPDAPGGGGRRFAGGRSGQLAASSWQLAAGDSSLTAEVIKPSHLSLAAGVTMGP